VRSGCDGTRTSISQIPRSDKSGGPRKLGREVWLAGRVERRSGGYRALPCRFAHQPATRHQVPGPRPQVPGPRRQAPGARRQGPDPQTPRPPDPQTPRPPDPQTPRPPDPQAPRPEAPGPRFQVADPRAQGLRPSGPMGRRATGKSFRGKKDQREARGLEPEPWRLIWTLGPGACYCCWALAARGVETTRRAPMRSVFPTRRLSAFSCSTVVRYLRARPKSVSPRCTR
jgi:hypothetical protein